MINERIRMIQKEFKLSQQEFGHRFGVSRDVINNLVNGRVEPTELILKAICNEFNVSRLWLETGEGEMFLSGDDDLLAMMDDLLDGENEFAKSVFRAFAKFSDEEWKSMQKFCEHIIEGIKKEPRD